MTRTHDRYLYAIRVLKEKYLCVRAVDVAHFLDFSKATVSLALRQLRDQGLVVPEADGNLLLTPEGNERAGALTERVLFFERVLTSAGVAREQALQDAIASGWEMSDASFNAFRDICSPPPQSGN